MASICLKYLLFEDFADGPWKDDDEIESRTESYPFLRYATWAWGRHSRVTERDLEVWSSLH